MTHTMGEWEDTSGAGRMEAQCSCGAIWRMRSDGTLDQVTDLDCPGPEREMQDYTIVRDNDRDLRFTGEIVATVASPEKTGRWTELTLYRTAAGKYVAQEVGRTKWEREHDRYAATVCETQSDVLAAFGTGWLAKQMYDAAGIECVETVD